MYSSKESKIDKKTAQRLMLERIAAENGISFELVKKIAKSQTKSLSLGILQQEEIKIQHLGKFNKTRGKEYKAEYLKKLKDEAGKKE